MARYIDLEEIVKRINDNIKPETLEEKALIEWCKDECIRQAYAMPKADVVPKSEVDKAIDDLKRYVILNENISKKCKAENGEQNVEYWKGKLSAFLQVRGYIDTELKNKYADQKND